MFTCSQCAATTPSPPPISGHSISSPASCGYSAWEQPDLITCIAHTKQQEQARADDFPCCDRHLQVNVALPQPPAEAEEELGALEAVERLEGSPVPEDRPDQPLLPGREHHWGKACIPLLAPGSVLLRYVLYSLI